MEPKMAYGAKAVVLQPGQVSTKSAVQLFSGPMVYSASVQFLSNSFVQQLSGPIFHAIEMCRFSDLAVQQFSHQQ